MMFDYKKVVIGNNSIRTYRQEESGRIYICVDDMMKAISCTSFKKYAKDDADYMVIKKSDVDGKGWFESRNLMSLIPINGIMRISSDTNMHNCTKQSMKDIAMNCAKSWLHEETETPAPDTADDYIKQLQAEKEEIIRRYNQLSDDYEKLMAENRKLKSSPSDNLELKTRLELSKEHEAALFDIIKMLTNNYERR